jgi:hypothetical protein
MNGLIRFLDFIGHLLTPSNNHNASSGHNIALASAWGRFMIQWNSLDMLDQKAERLLAVIAVIITIAASFGHPSGIIDWHNWPWIASLLSLATSGWFALLAYRPQNYQVIPDPGDVIKYSTDSRLDDPERETIEMLTRVIGDAVEHNNPICEMKVCRLQTAHIFLVIGLVLIVIGYAIR